MRQFCFLIAFCFISSGCRPPSAETSLKTLSEETLKDLHYYIERDVAAGFLNEEEIVTSAVETLSDEHDAKTLTPHAVKITREALITHMREQARWPKTTDCDRLDAAFAALEQTGVICRQDFSCCGTCGSAEIWDEIEQAHKKNKPARGYAFYHMQDTESAVEGDGLYLNYGAVQETETAAIRIGKEIAGKLKEHALEVEWDGSWKNRIHIKMDWKRRRQQ